MAEPRVLRIVISDDDVCELCGEKSECRPYGPDGKNICHICAEKDMEGTRLRMTEIFNQHDYLMHVDKEGEVHSLMPLAEMREGKEGVIVETSSENIKALIKGMSNAPRIR